MRERHTPSALPMPLAKETPLPQWIDTLWTDLVPRLAEPLQVSETDGRREVDFLGLFTFLVDPTRMQVRLLRHAPDDPEAMMEALDLLCPVSSWLWLESYLDQIAGIAPRRAAVTVGLKGRVREAEWDHLRRAWIRVTCGSPDCDVHHSAVVLEIHDEDDRRAWLRARVGDSLRGCYLNLEELFQFMEEAIESIRRQVMPEAWAGPQMMPASPCHAGTGGQNGPGPVDGDPAQEKA